MRPSARTALVAILALGLLGSGCEDSTPTTEVRQAVESRVGAYLDALAVAYSSLDAGVLEPYATSGEIVAVRKLLKTLLESGDRVEAQLLRVEYENIDVFRIVNATVRTIEVWQVVRFDPYTGREKGRTDGSVQHAIIQLRLVDGRWMVTARRVLESDGVNRWGLPTPAPTPAGAL